MIPFVTPIRKFNVTFLRAAAIGQIMSSFVGDLPSGYVNSWLLKMTQSIA